MNENECCQGETQGEVERYESPVQDNYAGTLYSHGTTLSGHIGISGQSEVFQLRDFSVTNLNYGFNVKVGCHIFAIETKESLIKALTQYITDPSGTEKKWWDTKTI